MKTFMAIATFLLAALLAGCGSNNEQLLTTVSEQDSIRATGPAAPPPDEYELPVLEMSKEQLHNLCGIDTSEPSERKSKSVHLAFRLGDTTGSFDHNGFTLFVHSYKERKPAGGQKDTSYTADPIILARTGETNHIESFPYLIFGNLRVKAKEFLNALGYAENTGKYNITWNTMKFWPQVKTSGIEQGQLYYQVRLYWNGIEIDDPSKKNLAAYPIDLLHPSPPAEP